MNGAIYIVGAGPGDPSLITVRGAEVLARADIVFFDRLVHPETLAYAPPTARRIYVGKSRGADPDAQANIHERMIAEARAGRVVVRLKGGDPFVFGRGGEEIQALAGAGAPFEIVPGVSAAVAAPAGAGISLSLRGVASAFGVFAAHSAAGGEIDWGLAARMPTAVFLMGVARLPELAARLIECGRAPSTPVAVIERATLPEERVVFGTLADIADRARGVESPATIVVGETVGVAASLGVRGRRFRVERETLSPTLIEAR